MRWALRIVCIALVFFIASRQYLTFATFAVTVPVTAIIMARSCEADVGVLRQWQLYFCLIVVGVMLGWKS
jgi:hypothetical protein